MLKTRYRGCLGFSIVRHVGKDGDGQPIGASVCNDITDSDNTSAAIGGYQAGPGYDAATGWGSPIGTQLLNALRAIV